MTHSLITADQLAKLREAIDWMKHPEALAILKNLPEVEVVAWVNVHGGIISVKAKDSRYVTPNYYVKPLYGSKT